MNQTNAEADQAVAASMPRFNGTEPQSTTAEVILVETVNSSASVFQIPVGTFTNQETTTLEIKQELVNTTDNKRSSRTKSRTAQARTGSESRSKSNKPKQSKEGKDAAKKLIAEEKQKVKDAEKAAKEEAKLTKNPGRSKSRQKERSGNEFFSNTNTAAHNACNNSSRSRNHSQTLRINAKRQFMSYEDIAAKNAILMGLDLSTVRGIPQDVAAAGNLVTNMEMD
jgi:hypothetical protein